MEFQANILPSCEVKQYHCEVCPATFATKNEIESHLVRLKDGKTLRMWFFFTYIYTSSSFQRAYYDSHWEETIHMWGLFSFFY